MNLLLCLRPVLLLTSLNVLETNRMSTERLYLLLLWKKKNKKFFSEIDK